MKREILEKILVLMTCLSIGGWGVQAAESTELPVYEEEEVVVTATRIKQEASKTPGKTEVITKEEIAASGATTVAEALTAAGVVISTSGGAAGQATVQLDGAKASQTLVLINGIPANTGCGGEVDLSFLPIAGIKQIEVAHGPLSALYGANALGGVVNIITNLTGEPVTNLTMSGGSNDSGRLEMALQQNSFGIAFGGSYTDGHRSRSETINDYLMGQYDIFRQDNQELVLHVGYATKDYQSPGSLGFESKDDGLIEDFAVDLTGKYKLRRIETEYKFYGQRLDYKYEADNPTSQRTSEYQTTKYGTDIAGRIIMGNQELLSGISLIWSDFESNMLSNGRQTRKSGAVFLQDIWTLNEAWLVTTGLRWDTGSDYTSPICPRINITHLLSKEISLKLGYGKAFRIPTMLDLYYDDGQYHGNSDLKPEYGERYEFTGEWKQGPQNASVNLFYADIKDAIIWNEQSENNKMQIWGMNLNWQNQWDQFLATGFTYNWTDKQAWEEATQSYSSDENVFGKSRYTFNLRYNRGAWRSNLNWNYVTERNNKMSDYDVVNLTIKYQANPQLSYGLTVNNLGDEQYEVNEDYPMPGREYYLSANYTF